MEQALDLELTVRFTKRDGEWLAALGDELDSLSPEELEGYRVGLNDRSVWCVQLLLRRIQDEACREGLIPENLAWNISIFLLTLE